MTQNKLIKKEALIRIKMNNWTRITQKTKESIKKLIKVQLNRKFNKRRKNMTQINPSIFKKTMSVLKATDKKRRKNDNEKDE